MSAAVRYVLADPTGQIERECKEPAMTQRSVALTYALAIRDEHMVPVDWTRANAAIVARWPRGLERVKKLAWTVREAVDRGEEHRDPKPSTDPVKP